MKYCKLDSDIFFILFVCALVTVLLSPSFGKRISGQDTDFEIKKDKFKAFALKVTKTANLFRLRAAIVTSLAFNRFGSKSCIKHWHKDIQPLFDTQELDLREFFGNAVILLGCLDRDKAVVGFYNPWIDGIVVSEWYSSDTGIKMDRFFFSSGESIRQEEIEYPKGVIPLWQRSDLTIARAFVLPYLNTTDRFEQEYLLTGQSHFLPGHLERIARGENQKKEIQLLKKRLRLRMLMFQEFIQAEEHSKTYLLKQKAIDVKKLIQQDKRAELEAMITGKQSEMMLDALFNEGAVLNADLGYNCILLKENHGAVILVNPRAPQWFIALYIRCQLYCPSKAMCNFLNAWISANNIF